MMTHRTKPPGGAKHNRNTQKFGIGFRLTSRLKMKPLASGATNLALAEAAASSRSAAAREPPPGFPRLLDRRLPLCHGFNNLAVMNL